MRSPKSRSRSKNNRNRPSGGNVVNRVFDSSGPEGKVRGTPQQIIDKYQSLARDAQLSNDRVAAENFLQHAEHYTRMLGEAQREMDERRLQQEREHQQRQQREQDQQRQQREAQQEREQRRAQPQEPQGDRGRAEADEPAEGAPDAHSEEADGGPIETPEERKRTRRTRSRRQSSEQSAEPSAAAEAPPPEAAE